MKFHYLKWGDKLVPEKSESEFRQKFIDSVPDGTIFVLTVEEKEQEVRTSQMNRYLWAAVYKAFVPEHFETAEDAHAYFAKKYLTQHDLIELTEENLGAISERLLNQASKTIPPKFEINNDRVSITWVRSTTSLSKKEFAEYLEKVTMEAGNLGITILPLI